MRYEIQDMHRKLISIMVIPGLFFALSTCRSKELIPTLESGKVPGDKIAPIETYSE
ncbi:MAG: hypothetical protein HY762_03805 [Planctomycetes bacterium]|nr:hypothetical protein [Planctomycetota bacterium]